MKCGVTRQSRLRVNFNTYRLVRAAEGGQRNEVRSRSNPDLAPSSELRYLGRSASRQSSLPINHCDCQQTATNYLLYQSRAYTEHQIFFAFHNLLKRYMKAQQLVQCMVPRALFGGVWNTSKSVYSSDSQLLLSRPTVSGAYLKKYTRKSTTRGISYTASSTQQLLFFFYRFQLYCFQHVAADVFSFFGLSFSVSSCCY